MRERVLKKSGFALTVSPSSTIPLCFSKGKWTAQYAGANWPRREPPPTDSFTVPWLMPSMKAAWRRGDMFGDDAA